MLDNSLVLGDLLQFAVSLEFVHNVCLDLQQESKDSDDQHQQVTSHRFEDT